MKSKKAQAWGFDMIVGTGIFILGITAFFLYTVNYPTGEQEKLDDLIYEGNIIGSNLLSEGFPADWTVSTVSKIGLLSDKIINQSKLEEFNTLASSEYGRTKAIFGIKYNYFINFSEPIQISGSNIEGIGLTSENKNNNIKVSRVSIYQNKPITIDIQIWD
ncbi:MAG: hypothetical protein AABX23_02525 [Nanoarchaeota archaeon]